jgi:hypothetical protein
MTIQTDGKITLDSPTRPCRADLYADMREALTFICDHSQGKLHWDGKTFPDIYASDNIPDNSLAMTAVPTRGKSEGRTFILYQPGMTFDVLLHELVHWLRFIDPKFDVNMMTATRMMREMGLPTPDEEEALAYGFQCLWCKKNGYTERAEECRAMFEIAIHGAGDLGSIEV